MAPIGRHRLSAALGLVLLLAGAVLLLAFARPATAQSDERIHRYDIAININTDGSIEVLETIEYDFGAAERHGIVRDIATRQHYDGTHDRRYPLDVIEVNVDAGASDRYEVEDAGGGLTRIRIGDPDSTITGRHTYVILYRLERVMNRFEDHDELYWNVINAQWAVPITAATVRLNAPAEVQRSGCFAGPVHSALACDEAGHSTSTARYTQMGLEPYEAFTIVAALPAGTITEAAPILVERWSAARAFSLTPTTISATAVLTLLVLATIGRLLWLAGRDRRWRGSAVDAVFGTAGGAAERVPLFDGGPFPVEYSPPADLRPGEIGTLRDEVAHPLDVTATIVDLATRGYMRIEEVEEKGLFRSKEDWRLIRLAPDNGPERLEKFERLLLDGLFEDGDEVLLSDLRLKFAARLQKVQDALYEATVAHGWYRKSPGSTRTAWLVGGFVLLAAGIGLFVLAVTRTHWGIVPIPLMLGGVLVIAAHHLTPARTPKGTATLRRIRGFERFIGSAEIYRSRFAEQARLFYDYLPYAIVFGLTDHWAKAFEGLDDIAQPAWYSGATPFHVLAFSNAMNSFAVTSAGTVAATPGGSGGSGFGGGGFSGGGGGGGGGGSW